MKKKSKLKTIIQAFTKDTDTSSEMYKERLSICNDCEYNSDNKEYSELKETHKLSISTICSGSPVCTACGCCILKKIGESTESCGLVELGKDPKWNAVKVETSTDKNLDLEILNKTAESVRLSDIGDAFIIELGNITDAVKEIELLITRKAGLNVSSIKAGCSCTVPTQKKIDENTVKILAKLNTIGFTKDIRFSKNITITYFVNSLGKKTGVIKLTGTKK